MTSRTQAICAGLSSLPIQLPSMLNMYCGAAVAERGVGGCDACHRAAEHGDVHERHGGSARGADLDDEVDGVVREFCEVDGFPVTRDLALGEEGVEGLLHEPERHLSAQVGERCREFTQGLEDVFAFVGRPGVQPADDEHLPVVYGGRECGIVRHRPDRGPGGDLVGCGCRPVTPRTHDVGRGIDVIHRRYCHHDRAEFFGRELEHGRRCRSYRRRRVHPKTVQGFRSRSPGSAHLRP